MLACLPWNLLPVEACVARIYNALLPSPTSFARHVLSFSFFFFFSSTTTTTAAAVTASTTASKS